MKSKRLAGGCDRDEALDLRAAHQELHADPGPEGYAGDPAGAGVRVDGLRPVERRGGVRQFALAVVERALAAADAAEVEAQHREAAVHEVVEQIVDDLVVHRAAELRMRVQHDGDGRAPLLGGLIAAFDAAGRAGENNLRHDQTLSDAVRPARTAPSYARARLASGLDLRLWRPLNPFRIILKSVLAGDAPQPAASVGTDVAALV